MPEKIQDRSAYDFCYQPTLWPDVSDFKNVWESYYAEMERLAQRVMSAFAEALGLENSYFDNFIDHPISALRALHYPATKSSVLEKQQQAGAQ